MKRDRYVMSVLLSFLTVALLAMPTRAQEGAFAWTDQAELSFVFTAGNSSASTLGLKNTLVGEGGTSKLTFEAGAIRTESSIRTRTANGTVDNFTITETSVSDITAENYFARGRYDLTFSERAVWFAGTSWDRNTFAGIDNRVTFVSGFGRKWVESEPTKFRTDLGATYTVQDNVVAGPTDKFGGVRFVWELLHQLTESTRFRSDLVIDENLKDTDDLRGDFINSLTVAMSERLALKTSLQLLFDNQPSFVSVPLFTGGAPTANTVLAELRNIDSIFTVALVLSL